MARSLKTKSLTSPPESTTSPEVPKNTGRKTLSVMVVLILLLVAALAVAGYFYYQYRNSPTVKDAREIEDLTKAIGGLMLLPSSETPTLATVTDKEKLVDQPFFAKAENGDKVLIYSQSGRAILYRPNLKKIVDVTTVNVTPPTGSTTTSTPPTTTAPPTPPSTPASVSMAIKVAIYNGGGEAGAGAALEKQIHALYPDITFPATTDAANSYDDSRVVDLTGKNPELTQAFANLVKGSIRTLPEGEKAPEGADVLIIVGKSK